MAASWCSSTRFPAARQSIELTDPVVADRAGTTPVNCTRLDPGQDGKILGTMEHPSVVQAITERAAAEAEIVARDCLSRRPQHTAAPGCGSARSARAQLCIAGAATMTDAPGATPLGCPNMPLPARHLAFVEALMLLRALQPLSARHLV